jgi:hypothetical protein
MNERTLKFKFVVVIFAVKLTVQKLYLNIQKNDFLVTFRCFSYTNRSWKL